jgi:hypothetical protein
MAVETHGIDEDMILAEWGAEYGVYRGDDPDRPVNSARITVWITRAAGTVNAALRSQGIDPTAVDDDAQELVRSAIITRVLQFIHFKLRDYEQGRLFREDFNEQLETLRRRPEVLGDAQDTSDTVHSNISTTATSVAHSWGSEQW